MAVLISSISDSNSCWSWRISWWLVGAMAACEANDSASWRSAGEKVRTCPVSGSSALIS